jgi:hypothetical protein
LELIFDAENTKDVSVGSDNFSVTMLAFQTGQELYNAKLQNTDKEAKAKNCPKL